MINNERYAFVSAVAADACFMVHLVCLFMKTHLLALLQDNCLDLVRCAFWCKLSACMRNITAFCQHLLRPIISAILADTDISVKLKYRPGRYIGLSPNLSLSRLPEKFELSNKIFVLRIVYSEH